MRTTHDAVAAGSRGVGWLGAALGMLPKGVEESIGGFGGKGGKGCSSAVAVEHVVARSGGVGGVGDGFHHNRISATTPKGGVVVNGRAREQRLQSPPNEGWRRRR